MRNLFLAFAISVFMSTSCVGQDFNVDSSNKYKIEDSLYFEWVKTKIGNGNIDPDIFSENMEIVTDSSKKIMFMRNVRSLHFGTLPHNKSQMDSLMADEQIVEFQRQFIEQSLRDSGRKKMIINRLKKNEYNQ